MMGKKQEITGTRLAIIVSSMYFGVFLGALDTTIVTSLLSHIASELHELGRISWIATGYLVACAAFQPLYGKISDIYGRKEVLLFCNIMFGLGCLICGISNRLETLVLGRIVSGIGGGGIFTLSTIAVSDLVSLRQRGIFQGFGNICFGLGSGAGGVFGGLVTDLYGWRMAFLVQVPLIVISIVLIWCFFTTNYTGHLDDDDNIKTEQDENTPLMQSNNSANPQKPLKRKRSFSKLARVDFFGSLSLVSMLILLMFAISTGGKQIPWSHPAIPGLIGASLVMCGVFVYIELYVAKEPVIPVRLFTNRTILASSLTNFFMTMAIYTILFFVPVLFSSVNDMSNTEVGQRLMGNFAGVSIGSFAAGYYMRHTGKYLVLGLLSPVVCLVGITFCYNFDQSTSTLLQYLALFLNGTGYAAMLTVTLIALIAAVPPEFQAVSTSIQYAFRGVGSTLGVSAASAVFENVLESKLFELVPQGDNRQKVIDRVLDSVEAIREVPEFYRPSIIESFLGATHAVILFALIAAFVGSVCAAAMKEYPLDHHGLDNDDNEQSVE